jgi:hypothetical protein
MKPDVDQVVRDVCPASPGAKDWQPTAWSPRTKLLYVPHQHLCMNYKTSEVGYIAGTPFVGATVDMYAGPGGNRGEFMAWDPVAKKESLVHQRELPGLERRSGNGGRRRLLRHHGPVVQSGRCKDGEAFVEVPRRLWVHWPADNVPGQ